jgi:hypothetical protein
LSDFIAGLAIGTLMGVAILLVGPAIERKANRSRFGRRRRWLP